MRVLIVGASGLVGHALWRDWRGRPGWEVRGTFHARGLPGLAPLDARDPAALRAFLREFKPEAVVWSASNSHVDFCEAHAAESRAINVEAPLRAAETARAAGAGLRAATDVAYCPTYAPSLAAALAALLETGARGVFHAAGAEEWTRYDFTVEAARTFGLDPGLIEPVTCASLKAPAARPLRSSLRSRRLPAEVLGLLWGTRRALEHMRRTQGEWAAYRRGLAEAGPALRPGERPAA